LIYWRLSVFVPHQSFSDATMVGGGSYPQILNNVEAKYQAEHERVRQWLEENDML
jgi:hypothetical protein